MAARAVEATEVVMVAAAKVAAMEAVARAAAVRAEARAAAGLVVVTEAAD